MNSFREIFDDINPFVPKQVGFKKLFPFLSQVVTSYLGDENNWRQHLVSKLFDLIVITEFFWLYLVK